MFGSLGDEGLFHEDYPYQPNSPYSASKAGSDHLVRAWHHTYGLPTLITNCSNNYGPYHFPEKLIPLVILNALEGKPLPVYGKGENVRDWLYVDDHADALLLVASEGQVGASYNIGGWNERRNIDVVRAICGIVDELAPDPAIGRREASSPLSPIGRDTTFAMRLMRERSRGTSGGGQRRPSNPGCVKRLPGISRTAPGGSGCAPASTAASGSGLRSRSAMLTVKDTAISAVKVLTPKRFDDGRGFFAETYNKQRFSEAGVPVEFVQDNHSRVGASGHGPGLAFSECAVRPG